MHETMLLIIALFNNDIYVYKFNGEKKQQQQKTSRSPFPLLFSFFSFDLLPTSVVKKLISLLIPDKYYYYYYIYRQYHGFKKHVVGY